MSESAKKGRSNVWQGFVFLLLLNWNWYLSPVGFMHRDSKTRTGIHGLRKMGYKIHMFASLEKGRRCEGIQRTRL